MDPVARRTMWRFIADTMAGRAVILTTHLMDECEALCKRIGIMVSGSFACIGTSERLKDKFGSGYVVQLSTNSDEFDRWVVRIMDVFEGILVMESHPEERSIKFKFPESYGNLAQVFK